MDGLNVDRIRRATFPVARRGYSKRAVHRFLDRLAEWLETGEGDPARAELLRRDLARVGRRTAAVLDEAEDAARRIRADAEREAAAIVRRAREEAELIRGGLPRRERAPVSPPPERPKRRPVAGSAARPPRPR
jgi:DivIVA domain-containing protein